MILKALSQRINRPSKQLRDSASWFSVGFCFTIVIALVGFGQYVARRSDLCFYLAYGFLFAAYVATIVRWLFSDTLLRRQPRKLNYANSLRAEKARTSLRAFRRLQISVAICITGVFGFTAWLIYQLQDEKQLQALAGYLYPASDPTPPNVCGALPNAGYILFLGNSGNAVAVTMPIPQNVITVGGRPILQVTRDPRSGRIGISLKMQSRDGRIVIELSNGTFTANPNNYIKFERPDKSTLFIRDQTGTQYLQARYLNKTAFRLSGVLDIPGYGPVRIFPDAPMRGSCIRNANPFASAIDLE